jgi:FolB domain-containing protein
MQAHIKNLRLRTIVGIFDWEKKEKQDLIINVRFIFDGTQAAATDRIEDTVDYKRITKKICAHVEGHTFNLLERVAHDIAVLVLDDDPRVERVSVEVDKPLALRFADSVSIAVEQCRVR